MADRVYIFDTTLRDGEQAPGYSMNLEEKMKMARTLELLGVDIIEAGFAISSPGDFESVRAIASVVENATVASLARALRKDIDAAWNAVKEAKKPRIHLFLATSDIHLEYKLKLTREAALERVRENVSYARSLCDDIEFSLEDATRTDLDYMCQVVQAAIECGATTINLPDTVGYAIPQEITNMVTYVRKNVKDIDKAVISMHCHNDLGLAVANTISGIQAGARQVECTLCGIGERAGNAALEEIAMLLRTRHDVLPYETGINTKEISRSARLLSSTTGVKIFPSKAIVGANAFAHESGIHQHGMMANSRTYEIMTPESVGVSQTSLVLGKHSGKHALREKLISMGYELDDEALEAVFTRFKDLADKKKNITGSDIEALVLHRRNAFIGGCKLLGHVVNTGHGVPNTSYIKLQRGDEVLEDVAIGTGPLDASFQAINHMLGLEDVRLESFSLNAVTDGEDAVGEAVVKLEAKSGETFTGTGLSTDIIESSIRAYVNGINKMMEAAN